MTEMPPILVADLFPEISQHLVALLRLLSEDDWRKSTTSSQRNVKDIASHLLDGSLRRLSMQRDGYFPPDGSSGPQVDELIMESLNRLNSTWESAARRLSPQVLVDLIEWADVQLADLFQSLDPFGPAIFPVAWAGEEQSQNWMDVARDYTEKWHHTQQIFEATGRPSTITERRLFHPCLDIFMRALPYTYRNVGAEVGSTVAVVVTGEAGGSWFVERTADGWRQTTNPANSPISTVTMDQLTAWKLVTKRRSLKQVREQFPDIVIEGDERLGQPVLGMVSVMA
ncbi:MAG: maleylpyruvate isomerase N-terminal domain-containing protein [Pirellulaceae bacterium]